MKVLEITSAQNPKLKEVAALMEKSRERRRQSLFVVEGMREIAACVRNGFDVKSIFFNSSIVQPQQLEDLLPRSCDATLFSLAPAAYSKIAYRESTEGVVAVVQEKRLALQDVKFGRKWAKPLVLVVESVEKPGNLGALLRTADACGVDAVLVCDPLTDLYNPNLIRSSIGAIFTVPVATATSEETIKCLKDQGIKIYTAQLQDSEWYYDTDMRGGTALVMGTEATGLTTAWRKAADAHIKIPMLGKLDSLNVSVSAAILMFEAVRQRNS